RDHAALAYQGVRAEDRRFRADLRFELDGSLPKAKLPYSDLARVLVNVVNNACYATRERRVRESDGFVPEVVVSSRLDGESVVVCVRDNGGGIPPALQRRVFDPFFTTKPPGDGTGLGLSMSYDIIVNQLGGAMRIDSVVDEHTALVFRIPLTDAMGQGIGERSE
ncbi:MAG: histidine kinase, partial [Myxococcales bacterium]|nr:histidine kinase [Myxococcales bacterium]